jgi:hypothetical protein
MTKRNHEKAFVVDMEMLPFPLNISKALAIPNKTIKNDLVVEIIATMLNWFSVAAVTEFSFKWVESFELSDIAFRQAAAADQDPVLTFVKSNGLEFEDLL